jgi:hypothetical protein
MYEPNPRHVVIITIRKSPDKPTEHRRILPKMIRFGNSQYHHESRWLLEYYDIDKERESVLDMECVIEWINIGRQDR